MLASGFLSPVDTVRAKLQEQIGFFLSSRAKLIRLMSDPQLTVQGQARGLYVVQTRLEDKLQNEIAPKIQVINTGVWNSSDLLLLGGFTIQLMNQIKAVNSLERQVGGQPVSFFDGVGMPTVAIGGMVLVGLGIMSGVFFGKRQHL